MEVAELLRKHFELTQAGEDCHRDLIQSKFDQVKVSGVYLVLSCNSDSHLDILKTIRENRVNDLMLELFEPKWLIIFRYLGTSNCLKMLSTDKIVVNCRLDERISNLVKINVMLYALFLVLLEKTCKVPTFVQKEYLYHTFYWNESLQELSHQE